MSADVGGVVLDAVSGPVACWPGRSGVDVDEAAARPVAVMSVAVVVVACRVSFRAWFL